MKKLKKISLIVMSIILCLTILSQTATAAFLTPGNVSERYIRDIKLIYADSVDEAKTQLPEDYSLLENNLNEDGSVNIPEALRPYMGGKEKIIPVK